MKLKREIEKKYVVTDNASIDLVHSYLEACFNPWRTIEGVSTDTFWAANNVDFIRYRENTGELTFKITDKENIVDRAEENLEIDGDIEDVVRWCNTVFGDKVGVLTKDYRVFYCDGFILSLYKVNANDNLYLEVEAPNVAVVDKVSAQLSEMYNLRQEYRSLYQICFSSEGLEENLDDYDQA